MIHDNPRIAEVVRVYHGTVNPAQGKLPKGSLFINISTGKVYIDDGSSLSEVATSTAVSTVAEFEAKKAAAVASGESTPAKADFIGQLFVKTGTGAGLYISSGTTTPGWTLIAEKNA